MVLLCGGSTQENPDTNLLGLQGSASEGSQLGLGQGQSTLPSSPQLEGSRQRLLGLELWTAEKILSICGWPDLS